MRISACLIAGAKTPSLTRAIASIRPMVDEVVLVRTADSQEGSCGADAVEVFLDGNFEVDCQCGCGSKQGELADFGRARNRSFELASGEWLTWIDSDDVVDGHSESLREMAVRNVRGLFPYAYSRQQSYYLPRLVPHSERWRYPIHEYLVGIEGERSKNVIWRHERTSEGNSQSRDRNWRLTSHHMTVHAAVFEQDARMWYYWGRAAADIGKPIMALSRLEKSYSLETWSEQRAVIAMLLANILPPHLVDIRRKWGWLAVQQAPRWPSAWRALAGTYSGDESVDFLAHAARLPLEDSFLVNHFDPVAA